MKVAIASCADVPAEFVDDLRLIDQLGARGVDAVRQPWDAADADWHSYDAVVIRSTWDYARRDER